MNIQTMSKIVCTLLLAFFACRATLEANHLFVEAKGAYFLPESSKFRKIYSEDSIYGVELSYQIMNHLYVWGSVDYFFKTGRSLGCPYHTKITMFPIGIGLKYFADTPWQPLKFYVGGGLLGNCVNIKDNSPYVNERENSLFRLGGIAKVGALIDLDYFFIDGFANYFQNFSSVRFGGWTFGVGIGKDFVY